MIDFGQNLAIPVIVTPGNASQMLHQMDRSWGVHETGLVKWFLNYIFVLTGVLLERIYLQPHYGNGVFGNVCLSAGQH